MLSILGMGCAHPENFIDNKFIENLDIGTNAQWIEEKIGVNTRVTSLNKNYIDSVRNTAPKGAREVATHTVENLGSIAALKAMKTVGIEASEIGMVITNSCNPSTTAPSLSYLIAKELGIKNSKVFDVTSACPAFALHMDFLNNYQPSRLPKYILCIAASTVTHTVDYNDRTDGAIWGDGAAAWIVSPTEKGKLKTKETFFDCNPTRCQAVVVDRFGHFKQDGRAVRDFSVRQTVRLIKRLEKAYELDWNRDVFIGHQANGTMLRQICNNRKIPPSNHWSNVSKYGNQAGAGSAIVLTQNWDKLESGQNIVVAVVGAGLSWGSVLFSVE